MRSTFLVQNVYLLYCWINSLKLRFYLQLFQLVKLIIFIKSTNCKILKYVLCDVYV